ncbi:MULTISPECIES: 2Fe-2S iron-sulfur cluster-binding protein [Echinimonadaceae]|uniref:2Fe-2S iron-sulfur cluster binding domain-containing protein n=2 Tax=Echinimonadaceae TaxID=3046600 RepID=A0A8J6R201_9GAMM|nr:MULTISPECIES: 2Fe-2S iron-sulfur cluster-binding protein [Echinimonadaceae]MBD1388405.1 2Fe-2S iron-sulfur cluster binding domain-containing protein [Neiella litorisoli]MCM2679807.1 2Fe-2S iron-sulfur cluster-binding protein [Echinimonas agarilytica]
MSLLGFTKSIHKWVSVAVGLQVIVWIGTGGYFALVDHHVAGGNASKTSVNHQGVKTKPLIPWMNLTEQSAESVKLLWILEQPYYQVIHTKPEHRYQKHYVQLFDAYSGELFVLTEPFVKKIANRSYTGTANVIAVSLVKPPVRELPREENAVWKVSFDDPSHTNVYIDKNSGRVISHIDDDRRLRDLMFRLHFMDYGNSGSFNHWLIVSAAGLTLALSVTGGVWLIFLFKSGLLRVPLAKSRKHLSVRHLPSGTTSDLALPKADTILNGLVEAGVFLQSRCGGGGTCGTCKFKSSKNLPQTTADQDLLSPEQLNRGYRLACQHFVSGIEQIEIDAPQEVQTYELTTVETKFITPFIKEIKFTAAGGKRIPYRAGAYMSFIIPGGTNFIRPKDLPQHYERYWQQVPSGTFTHQGGVRHYSLATYDSLDNKLIFNVRWQLHESAAGLGSSYLGALNVGDKVIASGPFSDFFASENEVVRRVLIGAGSGLAPLRAIIWEQVELGSDRHETWLIQGARNEDELAYSEEFETLSEEMGNFFYLPTLSSPSCNWKGKQGYVQQVILGQIKHWLNGEVTEFYLCGPSKMMIEVENILINSGVPSELIFKDDFSSGR